MSIDAHTTIRLDTNEGRAAFARTLAEFAQKLTAGLAADLIAAALNTAFSAGQADAVERMPKHRIAP